MVPTVLIADMNVDNADQDLVIRQTGFACLGVLMAGTLRYVQ